MDESKANNQDPKPEEHLSGSELEFERLMTRIVDDEASRDDVRQFEQLADSDPQLWKRLSMRQADMLRLSARLDRQMHAFEQVDLPELHTETPRHQVSSRSRLPLLSAVVGWAAVFMMAVIWGTTSLRDGHRPDNPNAIPASQSSGRLSPDDHLREYLRAPWVLGEMPPTLLQVDELSDGRKALRILRRIEEVTFIDPEDSVAVDEDGVISKPMPELHEASESFRSPFRD